MLETVHQIYLSKGYPGDQRTGVITGNILQGTRIKSSMLNDYGGNPQFVCETRTICEAESSEEQERIQKVEDNLAQLRRAVKVSRAWQQKHDETTEAARSIEDPVQGNSAAEYTTLLCRDYCLPGGCIRTLPVDSLCIPRLLVQDHPLLLLVTNKCRSKGSLSPRRAKKEPHKSL